MAFFIMSECLQWMKNCLKIFPTKCSLAVQALGILFAIIYINFQQNEVNLY